MPGYLTPISAWIPDPTHGVQVVVQHLLDENRDGIVSLPELTHLHILGEEYATQRTLKEPADVVGLLDTLFKGFNRATLATLLQQQQACNASLTTIQQKLKAS